MEKIAIIVPAYKRRFLQATLDSIAKQSCKDFTLYVGDDASPEDLEPVVRSYSHAIKLVYHRFEQNLGKSDLAGHWERCIALSTEPLVWLFSDDDIMPEDGIERVLAASAKYGEKAMFRLPLEVINAEGEVIRKNPPFKAYERISGYDFLLGKMGKGMHTAAIEYIFAREIWQKSGGFIKFPMAWCSDDATWASFADFAGGMITLPGNPVGWRNAEGQNISNSTCFDQEKLKATQLFLEWIHNRYASHKGDKELRKALQTYISVILRYSVRKNYSLTDLANICATLWKLDYKASLHVAFHHILHINLLT